MIDKKKIVELMKWRDEIQEFYQYSYPDLDKDYGNPCVKALGNAYQVGA